MQYSRESCTQLQLGNTIVYAKDLTKFGSVFDEKRTVLVDNNILSFLMQPDNAIHVTEFYDDASDRELSKVKELILNLRNVADVRVPLREIFMMRETLNNVRASKHL